MKVELLQVSLMNFIHGISKEIKWKVKVVLVEVSLMNFIVRISMEIKTGGESGVTRSIMDELHSSDIQGYQMECESDVTRNIIVDLHSSDIQGDQM